MFLVCVSECVYKVLHKSRSETREIKSEKETWWWQQKRRKKYAEKVQWNEKSADYCLANRKTKGNVLTKFSMKMRAFSSFFYISMCIYMCVCVVFLLTKPITLAHWSSIPLPTPALARLPFCVAPISFVGLPNTRMPELLFRFCMLRFYTFLLSLSLFWWNV